MKVKYIFMLLTFVILACTSDEETVFHEVSVSFSPAVHYNTRSVESEAYPGEIPFGVWAYSLPLDRRWAKDAPSAHPFMENEVVSYNAGSWLPTVPYQWRSDKLLTFFAYSPAWAGATFSLDNGITIANHDICDGYDLMFTRAVTDNNNHFIIVYCEDICAEFSLDACCFRAVEVDVLISEKIPRGEGTV